MKQIEIHFHNTIGYEGLDLLEAECNARNQEERIVALFRIFSRGTPSFIMKKYEERWPAIPLTSIRRSMSNLTKEGKLMMTDRMYTGLYGKPEHEWIIVG